MDVPSTAKGVVEKVLVTKGGKVSTGSVVVTVKSEGGAAAAPAAAPAPAKVATPAADAPIAPTAARPRRAAST